MVYSPINLALFGGGSGCIVTTGISFSILMLVIDLKQTMRLSKRCYAGARFRTQKGGTTATPYWKLV
jgi:hypothetical protein